MSHTESDANAESKISISNGAALGLAKTIMTQLKYSSLIYEPLPDRTELARRMRHVKSLGYDGIELTITHPLPFTIEEIEELTAEHDLPVVSFLSGWSYEAENLCLSTGDAGIRDRAVERLSGYAEQAARLGAVLVIGLMQGLRSDEADESKAHERIVDCLRRVSNTANKCGANLIIEPVNHLQVGFHHSADEVAALVAEVDSPALGYMLDTIHLNIEEHDVLETIRKHGPHVGHFHLCDTNGGPFGSAGLDFAAVLRTLAEIRFEHFVSVKIYRKESWDESSKSAMEFLKKLR